MINKPVVFANVLEAKAYIDPLRAQGRKLVTTNGCFDLLHTGHVRYLADAAAFGDLLVVGVNADQTVRKLKGPHRPLQSQDDRTYLVAALRMVDGAFVFPEDDPRAFLEVLKPDIHVKGGDYSRDIIERPTVERSGGRIEIVSFVQGYSTTSLVDRIRSSGT